MSERVDTMRASALDGCEWNPDAGTPAYDTDEHHRTTSATLIVGADGQWRLCDSCAALPQFSKFITRKRIETKRADSGTGTPEAETVGSEPERSPTLSELARKHARRIQSTRSRESDHDVARLLQAIADENERLSDVVAAAWSSATESAKYDVCTCGDYRYQHIDGGRCSMCANHRFPPPCQAFELEHEAFLDYEFCCPECGWVPPTSWYMGKSLKQLLEDKLHCWECASELFPEDEPNGIDA